MNATNDNPPRVVVLGAGFGGLTFCRTFNHPTARVTLVDRQNHHLFQPLLYQVATAGLSAPEIAQPIRSILRDKRNVTVLMRDVTGFDLARREVHLDGDVLTYDYLVLALGSRPGYFDHPEWEPYAPGLKSLDDALRIRRRVLLAFERAENSVADAERKRLMTMVVVGGGPTGVELAGAFAELAKRVLKRDFRQIDPRQARVILIEAAPRILRQFSERLSARAVKQLARLGVEVWTNVRVETIGDGFLQLADGRRLESANIFWTAGVIANPLTRRLGVELDPAGRVIVNPDLSVPGHPEVFAIGDLALVRDEHGRPVPGVSPAAMQMARHVARLIENDLNHGKAGSRARPAFAYRDKGMMATIGRSAAVAQIGRLEFSGWPAWAVWLLVHLIFLIGFRNRLAVLLQWTYSYFTYKLGSRIITGQNGSSGTVSAAAEQLVAGKAKNPAA
ncbi:MAG TPA: NAD(P)/FAD-dependent oxidoreductase [Verrucomicrobiae bacterium]|nr:NAD(P)/FAD-dependent oxidoreductase [Verrucomicrobiae bacterium]